MPKILTLYDGIEETWPFGEMPGFKRYLDEVWRSRPFLLSREEVDEKERKDTGQKFFDFYEGRIKARNYVGFLQYGDLRISIYPRVFHRHPEIDLSANATPAVQHAMKWLSYGSRVHF